MNPTTAHMRKNRPETQKMYSAFGRGDVNTILSHLTDDVSWESEGPARLSHAGRERPNFSRP
jgi:ketosteroid isomerase-like protein